MVGQRLRICLVMQWTWVQSLVREDRSHTLRSNEGHMTQRLSPSATNTEARVPRACLQQQSHPH